MVQAQPSHVVEACRIRLVYILQSRGGNTSFESSTYSTPTRASPTGKGKCALAGCSHGCLSSPRSSRSLKGFFVLILTGVKVGCDGGSCSPRKTSFDITASSERRVRSFISQFINRLPWLREMEQRGANDRLRIGSGSIQLQHSRSSHDDRVLYRTGTAKSVQKVLWHEILKLKRNCTSTPSPGRW